MMRSLFAGISGMRNHQVRMDVIGNNIANVNTVAFKASRVTFKEGFSQMMRGAVAPREGQGGLNPMQVGLGMHIGSLDTLYTQGSMQTTGVQTDLAIQGDALFAVRQGNQNFYTRAGNFTLDSDGRLVSGTSGLAVQGRTAVDGELTSDAIGDIRLPVNQTTAPRQTSEATLAGNLDASAEIGAQVSTMMNVYDAQGGAHTVQVTLTKTQANEWSWTADSNEQGVTVSGTGTLQFDQDGRLIDPATPPAVTLTSDSGQFDPVNVDLATSAGSGVALHQYAGASSVAIRDQNGYPGGTLQNFSIDSTGVITGAFSNGVIQVLGQVALADFNNPEGLSRSGDNLYSMSADSGEAVLGFATSNSPSSVVSGALEMSNVDITEEFTNMIVAQRGFQANSRVITSTDEMLQEIVNLKR